MSKQGERGYIFLDILIGLFILGIGTAVYWGLISSVTISSEENANYLHAVNLARSTLDELFADFKKKNGIIHNYIQNDITDRVEDRFQRIVRADWEEIPGLLSLTVEINWDERGKSRTYRLESSCYVGN